MNARLGISPGPARRALDIVASAIGLVVLAPVLLGIALAVRLTSPGPAVFKHERVRQGGGSFKLWKFRTMRNDAGGSDLTLANDPRITKVGDFLRRVRLDELPQLVNVLRGDMTLVGPRPEAPSLAERYPPEHAVIFRYRPGLTGPGALRLAQRDDLPTDPDEADRFYFEVATPERVRLDMAYLTDATLRKTLAFILETIRGIFRRGAATAIAEAEPGA